MLEHRHLVAQCRETHANKAIEVRTTFDIGYEGLPGAARVLGDCVVDTGMLREVGGVTLKSRDGVPKMRRADVDVRLPEVRERWIGRRRSYADIGGQIRRYLREIR